MGDKTIPENQASGPIAFSFLLVASQKEIISEDLDLLEIPEVNKVANKDGLIYRLTYNNDDKTTRLITILAKYGIEFNRIPDNIILLDEINIIKLIYIILICGKYRKNEVPIEYYLFNSVNLANIFNDLLNIMGICNKRRTKLELASEGTYTRVYFFENNMAGLINLIDRIKLIGVDSLPAIVEIDTISNSLLNESKNLQVFKFQKDETDVYFLAHNDEDQIHRLVTNLREYHISGNESDIQVIKADRAYSRIDSRIDFNTDIQLYGILLDNINIKKLIKLVSTSGIITHTERSNRVYFFKHLDLAIFFINLLNIMNITSFITDNHYYVYLNFQENEKLNNLIGSIPDPDREKKGARSIGGGVIYKQKYIKYKQKYLHLLNK